MFCDPLPLQFLSKNPFFSIFGNGVHLPPSYLANVFKYTVFWRLPLSKVKRIHCFPLGGLKGSPYLNERQASIEDGRKPFMEDDIQWKTTLDGKGPSMEANI